MDIDKIKHVQTELLPFMTLEARIDVKSVAVRYVLEMTGTKEGREFIVNVKKLLKAVVALTLDPELDISRDSYLTLVNLSAEEDLAWKLVTTLSEPPFFVELLRRVLEPDCRWADEASSIVANITRSSACAARLSGYILSDDSKVTIEGIVNALCTVNYNTKKAKLHYLATILSNLTQVAAVRKVMMDKNRCIIQKLMPFTEFSSSVVRRGGIIGALHNCCFEYDFHPWLLSEEVDILPRLLLPLAGPEEFDDDEMEKLPVDLQYLPPEKQRESDADLRTMLIESVHQLCCTQAGRLYIKDKNAYVILRELHKWEKHAAAKLACQTVCELLIMDEPEPGMEDFHRIDIPEDLVPKFEKMDSDLLKDIKEDLETEESPEATQEAVSGGDESDAATATGSEGDGVGTRDPADNTQSASENTSTVCKDDSEKL